MVNSISIMGIISSICSWIFCSSCCRSEGEANWENIRSITPSEIPDKYLTPQYKVPTKEFTNFDDVFQQRGYDPKTKTQLGQGGYGEVFKIMRIKDKKFVALKEIGLKGVESGRDSKKYKYLKTEIYVFRKIKHKNIVVLFDDFIINNYCYLVMELANSGDLHKEIEKNGPMIESTAKTFFIQIARAVENLHLRDPPIAHLDIKPANVLINIGNGETVLKLTDFGLSKVLKQRYKRSYDPESWTRTRKPKGTLDYMSPQMIQITLLNNLFDESERSELGKVRTVNPIKADIWSLGVTLYYMITGSVPFDTFGSNPERYQKLLRITLTDQMNKKRKPIEREISSELNQLLDSMLEPMTYQRIDIRSILKQKWLIGVPEQMFVEKSTIN